MKLDELVATIEELKSKISDHRASISSSESRTRQVLIDPLLRVLGWDVTDPTQVNVEYSAGQGRVDYALFGAQGPVAVVEAKRLGLDLGNDHVRQALNYANSEGIPYMVLSNGDEWRMYDVFRQAKLSERLIMEFRIETTPPYENALKSFRLWRANLVSGTWKPVVPTNPFASYAIPANPGIVNQTPTKSVYQQTQVAQDSESPTRDIHYFDTDWIPIGDQSLYVTGTEITAIKIQGVIQSKTNERISRYRARTGWYWSEFTQLIAKWLVNEGKLKPGDCPVFVTESTDRCFINDKPTHPNGSPFRHEAKTTLHEATRLPHGMWVDIYHSRQNHLEFTRRLLEKFGVNPNVVEIRLNQHPQLPRTQMQKQIGIDAIDNHWFSIADKSLRTYNRKLVAIKIAGEIQSKTNTSAKWIWSDLSQMTAKWLVDTGRLGTEHCPVSVTDPKKCLVNDKPIHPDGTPFDANRWLSYGMWIDVDFSSKGHVQNACQLLKKFGVDPSVVEIKVGKRGISETSQL